MNLNVNIMENETNKIIDNLKLFFNAEPIGSYLFYLNGFLSFGEINDVDVLVTKQYEQNIYNYLSSLGYSQTTTKGDQIGYEDHRCIYEKLPQGDFKKEGRKMIDVQIVDKIEVWPLDKIIASKFRRCENNDLTQLISIIESKINE